MSVFPPPDQVLPIFNPSEYTTGSTELTQETADLRYLKLTGGIERGLVSFSAGLSTSTILDGANTFTMPATSGQLALASSLAGYVSLATDQTITGVKTITSQIVAGTADAGGTPWTAPKYSFDGHRSSGFYFATDSSTYEAVGAAVNGRYILYTGVNLGTNSSYMNVANGDTTIMGGFDAASATGPGLFFTNGYLMVNDTASSVGSGTGALRCLGGAYFGANSVFNSNITTANGVFISLGVGSAAAVAFSVGGLGTGMYAGGIGQLNLSSGGVSAMVLASTYIEAQRRLRLISGDAAGPGLAFSSDSGNNSGIFLVAADNIGFSAGGTLRWDYNGSRISSTVPLYLPTGSAGAPALTFSNSNGDPDTGIYSIADGTIGFSSDGTLRWQYNSVRISSTVPVYFPDGSAALPALTFSNDNDTGIYRSAANFVAVSCGGVKSMQIEPNFQVFYDNLGIIRAVFRSGTTSGDVFNIYGTKGSTASYFYYDTSNTYGVVSDRSTKKNIRDVQLSKASQFIKKMSPKRYELISDEKITNNGFVAQDLKQIAEEVGELGQMITEHDDGLLGVAHNELLTVVVAALRDALERIETLEKK